MKDLLFELCNCDGISGKENNIADKCLELLSQYADVKKDYNNNVLAVLGNKNSDKTLLLDAHIDQIGLIVTDIDDNGFLKVDKCGGIDCRTLPGSPVKVFGKEVYEGVICCMPPHLSDGNEDKALEIDKIRVDVGLPVDIVKESISVGDIVSFRNNPKTLLNNNITSVALDNRAGVAALIKVCELISKTDLSYKVVILLSCQEETFGTGAKTKSFEINPDKSICVDVSFANQIGISDSYANIELGKGPMLCYSPTLDRELANTLKEIAHKNNIPIQIEVCGGRTGTNADHISVSKSGVKTAVLSIPQRNMHTQVEIVNIEDVENTAKLIYNYIISGGV